MVNRFGHLRLAAAGRIYPTAAQSELFQQSHQILPLRQKIAAEDGAGVLLLMDFVVVMDESRKQFNAHDAPCRAGNTPRLNNRSETNYTGIGAV